MKKEIQSTKPLTLTAGYYVEEYTTGYDMPLYAHNWKRMCSYQLRPHGLGGYHHVLQLEGMQIAYITRIGGSMHYAVSAKESFTLGVVESIEDKACFGHMKLHTEDIAFFDDSEPHLFVTNKSIKYIALSIQKSLLKVQLPKLFKITDHYIKDTDARLASTLHKIIERFADQRGEFQAYQEAEQEILTVLKQLLSEQTPLPYKLTRGEQTALDIRDQVLEHIDGKINIKALADKNQISEQTLQNSFKSLFGFTPQRFLRLMKLNHVHHELSQSNPEQSQVSKVASKWGFVHMGRFSSYYSALFGEYPSRTLKNQYHEIETIDESCAIRQEEMS